MWTSPWVYPLEEALGLLPRHEFGDPFGHLPEFVEIKVAIVGNDVRAALIYVVDILYQNAGGHGETKQCSVTCPSINLVQEKYDHEEYWHISKL